MTEAVEQLKTQARTLSVPERAELAHFLLTSLDTEEEGVQEAWRAEIERRVAEIRNGSATGRSADEVLTELRERYP
jgi:putative addiction module component (TIGR02574 family)